MDDNDYFNAVIIWKIVFYGYVWTFILFYTVQFALKYFMIPPNSVGRVESIEIQYDFRHRLLSIFF